MNNTMRLSLVAALALTMVVGLYAQQQRMRMTPEERTEQMAKQLSLTEEQKPKVLDILKKQDTKMREAFEKAGDDRDAMRETMQKIRQETDGKLKVVLTEEQYTQWQKIRQEQRPGAGRMGR